MLSSHNIDGIWGEGGGGGGGCYVVMKHRSKVAIKEMVKSKAEIWPSYVKVKEEGIFLVQIMFCNITYNLGFCYIQV